MQPTLVHPEMVDLYLAEELENKRLVDLFS